MPLILKKIRKRKMILMKNNLLSILITSLIISVAVNATTITLQPHYTINSITNTINFECIPSTSFNQTLSFGSNLIIINNCNLNLTASNTLPAFSSNTFSYGFGSIAPPSFPQVDKTFNSIIGGASYYNPTFNFTINSPSSIIDNITLNPTNKTLNGTLIPVSNVTFKYKVLSIPQLSHQFIIFLGEQNITNATFGLKIIPPPKMNFTEYVNSSYSNRTYNISLADNISEKILVNALINKHLNLNFTPSFTNNTIYSNSTLNLTILIHRMKKLNITKNFTFGEHYTNSTYGLAFRAPQVTSNTLNRTILANYYDNNIIPNCNKWVNVTYVQNLSQSGQVYRFCVSDRNYTYNIYDVCPDFANYGNMSYDLGSCVALFATIANSSAISWHRQSIIYQNQAQNDSTIITTLENGSNVSANYGTIIGEAGLLFLGAIILYNYFQMKNRGSSNHTALRTTQRGRQRGDDR